MKQFIKSAVLTGAAAVISASSFAWGAWGHHHINNAAVFALPASMKTFFYDHIDFITEEAVIPDLRKYINNDKNEGHKHFIDLEDYQYSTPEAMPQTLQQAKEKYGETLIGKSGILPWQMEDMMDRLTKAFKGKNKTEILYIAADLAHYTGDATQPFHTSSNYDGQLTGQKGIHAFFESQLPEQFGSSYNFHTEEAHYITDIKTETWQIIARSHSLVDTLLIAEKTLEQHFPAADIYAKNADGTIKKNQYNESIHSVAFAKAYHDVVGKLIETQLRYAASETASLWYTAWKDAGIPDLDQLDPEDVIKRNRKYLKKDTKLWEQGKLTGFITKPEFE